MKVLLMDLETAPMRSFHWGLWNQNIGLNQVIDHTYLLCWGAKWLDDDYIHHDALWYHKKYTKNPENDIEIVSSMHTLMDEADVIVAHNGDRFDIPVMNARFVYHGVTPPAAYQSIDTLKIARNKFRFASNKLEYIANHLGLGSKVTTGGFDLWKHTIDGRKEEQKRMIEYCLHDVELLEDVYRRLVPWSSQIPALYASDDMRTCNACGSTKIKKNGTYYTKVNKYQQYKCNECGHNMRERLPMEKASKNVLRSV